MTVLQKMSVHLPAVGPTRLRALATDGIGAAQGLLVLAPRVGGLLARADALIDRLATVLEHIDETQREARSVIGRVNDTQEQARCVIARAESTVTEDAPRLMRQLTDDVLPVVRTLRTVGPDLTELLAVSRALNEILGAVPGLGRAKKRADQQFEQVEDTA